MGARPSAGSGGPGQPSPERAWPRPGEAERSGSRKRQRGPRTLSTERLRGAPEALGASSKPMPRPRPAAPLAEVVAGWRPEIFELEGSEEDEDLEAAVAMEDVTPEEHLRLRLRYLKERRQAAQRAGPIGREDFLRCDAEITAILAETRQARPWPVRVQAAADALKTASQRVASLQTDLETARTTVTALEAGLAEAEAEQAAAQAAVERVQAEVASAPGVPAFTQQDMEVIAVLRALVTQAGMPIQDLLRQVGEAVAGARAEATRAGLQGGLAGGQAPGGGSGGLGAAVPVTPPLGPVGQVGQWQGSPTSSSPTSGSPTSEAAAGERSPSLAEVVARGLLGAAGPVAGAAVVVQGEGGGPSPTQPVAEGGAQGPLALTQAFAPGAAAALAEALAVPVGGNPEGLVEAQPAARARSRSPRVII